MIHGPPHPKPKRVRAHTKTTTSAAGAIEAPAPRSHTRGPRPNTKQAAIHFLLIRPEGVTVEQLVRVTGWQRPSVRAVLTLMKSNPVMEMTSALIDGVRTYRLVPRGRAT